MNCPQKVAPSGRANDNVAVVGILAGLAKEDVSLQPLVQS